MSSLLRAALIFVPALALGYVALGSGLDRMSEGNPALSRIVPQAFRSAAWRGGAAQDIARGNLRAARDKSTRAVLTDPMNAASSSGLGLVRLKLREGVAAEAAFRVAGQLGWRDQTTQLYWMALSAASGAFPLAAQRADALLRQDTSLREQPAILAGLEATAGGRKALAERLAMHPAWSGDYWNKLYLLAPAQLANRALVIDEPALRPPMVACAYVQTLIGALAQRNPARSRSIRERYCAGGGNGLLIDGGFEAAQLVNAGGPGWQFVGEGGLDVRLAREAGRGGKSVVITSALPLRQVFASQALELAPGYYRVGWRSPGKAGSASPTIAVRLTCQENGGDYLARQPSDGDHLSAILEIRPDCPRQWLDLAVDPGVGPVAVDDVTVERQS